MERCGEFVALLAITEGVEVVIEPRKADDI
jgi:hypothetical protein